MNNRNTEGGGVLIGIKEEIAGVSIEVKRESESHEAIWIKIDNGRIKVRIGVVYAPQENKCRNKELEKMYEKITEEVKKAEENGEKLLIMGDFNCKIGDAIKNNKEEVSRGGKELLKMIKDNKLSVLNNHIRCKGKWTRSQNEKKSVIDYVLIKEEDEERITKVRIDENKEITPYRITEEIVYTDHCAIVTEINWRKIDKREEQICNRYQQSKGAKRKRSADGCNKK